MKKVMFAILVTTLLFGTFAAAQTVSGPQSVALKATVQDYIKLSPSAVATVNFNIDPMDSTNLTIGDAIPSFGYTYSLGQGKTVAVCAYTTGATQGSNVIPVSQFLAKTSYTGAFAPAGTTLCGGQPGWNVSSVPVNGHGLVASNMSTIQLEISTFGFTATGEYDGTLNVVAQTI
jgi:hypothetical protein